MSINIDNVKDKWLNEDKIKDMLKTINGDIKLLLDIGMINSCKRCTYGCYILDIQNDDKFKIHRGYTHVPKNIIPCKECYRQKNHIVSGTRYECCKSIHAEQQAIMNMCPSGNYKILYLNGIFTQTKEALNVVRPCNICMKFILDSGIDYIVTPSFVGTPLELLNENKNGEYDSLLK